ncbi:hypothetical protein QQF64_033808 [Cirrhinus molitorella]|uniref:Uncharacterized protein n=1 Tax=Cirrhinus molitorella TaxID=172907 RepID=A0ABR3MUY0_9TELE
MFVKSRRTLCEVESATLEMNTLSKSEVQDKEKVTPEQDQLPFNDKDSSEKDVVKISLSKLPVLNEERAFVLPTEAVEEVCKHDVATQLYQTLTNVLNVYAGLAKATLARIIVFNRRRAGEVSKKPLKGFNERDSILSMMMLLSARASSKRKLCSHFSRVEIRGKRGRKVAVLPLTHMAHALTLLVSKRSECECWKTNVIVCQTQLPESLQGAKTPSECMQVNAELRIQNFSDQLNCASRGYSLANPT